MPFTPKTPYLTTDAIVEIYKDNDFKGIVLIKRKNTPLGLALPGGFVDGRTAMTNPELKLAEQSVGINNDNAVLVQSRMKAIANVPMSRYVDWFHNVVASGGFMPHQFN